MSLKCLKTHHLKSINQQKKQANYSIKHQNLSSLTISLFKKANWKAIDQEQLTHLLTKQSNKLTEDILQAQIYKWYHNTYCTKLNNPRHVIFAVPNGGHRSKSEAARFKATGLVAGVSDLIVIQPNRIIFVELKLEKGRQQKNQIEFENKVKALGFEYYVVRSLDDFKNII